MWKLWLSMFIHLKERLDFFNIFGTTMCVVCPLPSAGKDQIKLRGEEPKRMKNLPPFWSFQSEKELKDGMTSAVGGRWYVTHAKTHPATVLLIQAVVIIKFDQKVIHPKRSTSFSREMLFYCNRIAENLPSVTLDYDESEWHLHGNVRLELIS